jgi:molybdate transport system regulatory protein
MNLVHAKSALAISNHGLKIKYLMPHEIDALTMAFQRWFDSANSKGKHRCTRGRYWLSYLMLRFTGARLGEIVQIDDTAAIDFRAAEVRIVTLKRRDGQPKRLVPIPDKVVSEIATFLATEPIMRGRIFAVDPNNFRKIFYARALDAGILQESIHSSTGQKSIHPHPHTLRHTRAIELVRAGVPVPAVQSLLGHSSMLTTAEYVRLTNSEVKTILKERNLI